MALLKCKMCGGTLEYNRAQNLAVCPYCGTKSTVFEQDRKLYEQFQTMFASLLDQPSGLPEQKEGYWVEATREELIREDGQTIEISCLFKMRADLCTMYVAREHVLYEFEKHCEPFADNYIKMVSELQYPNPEMKRELSQYVPQVQMHCRLRGGGILIAVKKAPDTYPLRLLGILLDRHTAWAISRMENLCCLLSYNGMVLNGLTVDNLFAAPKTHQLYLYGGWWFAGYENGTLSGISGDVRRCIHKKYLERKRCHHSTDLESLRLAAAKLLGHETREEAANDPLLPQAFCQFLRDTAASDARKDFAKWDRVLKESYGERKFIPLPVTEEELYSRTEKQSESKRKDPS